MDLLRSCYRVPMVFRAGDPAVPVRWFRCKPGAELFEGEHAFFSYNWDTDEDLSPLGEQQRQPLPWLDGSGPQCATGRRPPVGLPEWWREGLPVSGTVSIPVLSTGVPGKCCCFSDPTAPEEGGKRSCGGVVIAGGLKPVCPWNTVTMSCFFPDWAFFGYFTNGGVTLGRDKLRQTWLNTQDLPAGNVAGNPSRVVRTTLWRGYGGCDSWYMSITVDGVGTWGPVLMPVIVSTPSVLLLDGDLPFGEPGPHFGELLTVGVAAYP